jgi:hypothetical protein
MFGTATLVPHQEDYGLDLFCTLTRTDDGRAEPVASEFGCKSAGVVPGFMIRLGDGADSFGLIVGLGCCGGTWPELAGWFEQRAAQVL